MKKLLAVLWLCGTAAIASDAVRFHVKSLAEVKSDPSKATVLELELASIDLMVASVRVAASNGNRDGMREALIHLRDTADRLIRDTAPTTGMGAP